MSAPKSKATKNAVSSAADFKKRKAGVSLDLPSGLTVRAQRVELRTFIEKGDVPNMLLPIIQDALDKGQAADMQQILGSGGQGVNLDMIRDMLKMVDDVVVQVVLEPKMHSVPEEENDRHDDLLYVDEMDDEDKMFLFQWSIGGTTDLEQFRREAEEGLASLAQGQGA